MEELITTKKSTLNTIVQAHNGGNVIVLHNRTGYHPESDRDRQQKRKNLIGKRPQDTIANEILFSNVKATIYVDALGWEAIFLFRSGNCTLYDILRK